MSLAMHTFRVWIYYRESDNSTARLVQAFDKQEARTIVNNDLLSENEPGTDYEITLIEKLSGN